MATIAALDSGTYYHHRSLHEPRYRAFFDEIVYVRDLERTDLAAFDIVLVSCRTDPYVLIPRKDQFRRFLDGGGTVVAMGSTGQPAWLPNVVWHDTPTNFWWWKEGGSLGLEVATPDHPLFGHITLADATWHHHGHFDVPDGAVSLIDVAGRGSVLYEDHVSTPGCMMITALDPMYHHGSHFMPATTRFLDGFLPYLRSL
ncbi:hypothetical protein [Polymorphum gilvum]|uniref:Uncharacterized protein n=1 Tax=Polymorphum gilvum (strain LMG 25793 / CGMCC 1.9160 / SL003B-26A1) TaxID=991905 RepID=F2J5V2_POLGS|nr:hypothetical protein [Polymorphum gilvum]ADZ71206.1 hypothetical protein SL003B_2783 [Polymorphum gilvum SL003B-26A1]